jgi:hypothetical protein
LKFNSFEIPMPLISPRFYLLISEIYHVPFPGKCVPGTAELLQRESEDILAPFPDR